MANEGSSAPERAISFAMRLLVSLVLPAWGLTMIVVGLAERNGWWIATGAVILAIGAIFFAGSSLMSPFLGGRRFS